MEDWLVLAFILIIIVSWLLRQTAGVKQSEESSSSSKGLSPLQKKLTSTFDEWSEQISSIEEYMDERKSVPEKQDNEINCPNCGIRLELGEEARQEKQFACPACRERIDLRKLGYDQRRTTAAPPERTGLHYRYQSTEETNYDVAKEKSKNLYGEKLLETKQSTITEEKPIAEQRLEESQKSEQKQSAEKGEPVSPLKRSGDDYFTSSEEQRKVLDLLRRKGNIRQAFLIMELIQPPVSMRTSSSIKQ